MQDCLVSMLILYFDSGIRLSEFPSMLRIARIMILFKLTALFYHDPLATFLSQEIFIVFTVALEISIDILNMRLISIFWKRQLQIYNGMVLILFIEFIEFLYYFHFHFLLF